MTQDKSGKKSMPIIARLAQLARSNAEPDQFLSDFFKLVHTGLAAEGGSVWLYNIESRQLNPRVSFVPEASPLADLADEHITKIVYRTIEQNQPVLYYPEESADDDALKELSLITVPVDLDQETRAVVLLARRKREEASYARDDVHTLQSLCVYLVVYFANRRLLQAAETAKKLSRTVEIEADLAGAMETEKMAFILANRAREVLFFDRTFVALPTRTGFKIAAVSGMDDVPQKGAVVQNLRDLAREVARIGGDWHFTPSYLEKVEDDGLRERLTLYFETTDYRSVLLMRMEDKEGLLGLMGFERREETAYTPSDFRFAQGICRASVPALRRARTFSRLPAIWLVKRLEKLKRKVTGSHRVRFFVKTALLVAAALILTFGRWNLKVKGNCRVVANVTAYAAPRYPGTVVAILRTENDLVKAGDAIALMDDREAKYAIRDTDLQIKRQMKLKDLAVGAGDPAAVDLAKLDRDRLDLRRQRQQLVLDAIEITSPIDGVIITPRDALNSALNSVLDAGDPIARIADVSKLYIEMEVMEGDVRFVRIGQAMTFAMAGAPNVTHQCTVVDISASTRAMLGRNVFIVRGIPDEALHDELKLGLTGSASLDAGQRHILYIIFRSTLEHLRTLFL